MCPSPYNIVITPSSSLSFLSPMAVENILLQEDKFYSRLLSKESSASGPSFRVYYGVAAGSVPFLWESRPGTPKHAMAATTLPPLTPPPSYYFASSKSKKASSTAKSPKNGLMNTIRPRLALRPPPSPGLHRRGRSSSSSISSNSRGEEDQEHEEMSPTSTLCFGEWNAGAGGRVKNALRWFSGRGSTAA
ncbi:hypothetical protein HPP92_013855 [Vanilla planifolia]|uniref:Uncharacterized protein n=1 Tax=Vanilla planifolia TaxID=51239 RepID=A0A835QVN0_VANPL|nr:hypothetical protein HPP92_013855 [Vanilla planifolia]